MEYILYFLIGLIVIVIVILFVILIEIKTKDKKYNLNDTINKNYKDLLYNQNTFKQDISQQLIQFINISKKDLNDLKVNTQKEQSQFSLDIQKLIRDVQYENNKDLNSFFEKTTKQLSDDKITTKDELNKFFEKTNDKLTDNSSKLVEGLEKLNQKVNDNLKQFEDNLFNKVETKMDQINEKVENRLNTGFKKTNETFNQIVERISKIDEAQRNIEKLSTEVVSLQDVLTDKKTRGIFGEVGLKQLLVAVYGENNDKVYQLQYKLPTNTIADCVLFTPSPLGLLCIDSKFPLENYQKMLDRNEGDIKRMEYTKLFKQDVKKHIDAIKNKYIIKDVTASQACMFLPSEAIFAEINAYHPDLVEYSYKANVWLTSPTTLMAFLTTIQISLQNIERNKYTEEIHKELEKLSQDFTRYQHRWNKLKKDIDTVGEDVNQIHTTTEKLSNRFNKINQVEFKEESHN